MSPPVLHCAWAVPNADTLRILPIAELLRLFVGKGQGWADPFAGQRSPAEHRNDLKPRHHGEAADFLGRFADESLQGIILDQTSRLRSINDDGRGADSTTADTWQVKAVAVKKIVPGGLAICCGRNSSGLGTERGFELIHVLDVRHGGDHADTIVTVEIKVPYQAADDPTGDDLAAELNQGQRHVGRGRSTAKLPVAPAGHDGACHDLQRAEYLTVKDVAILTSLSESYLRRKIYARELPAANIGSEARPVWRIQRKDLVAWLEARKGGTPSIPPKSQLRDLIQRHLPGL
ncbi:MAG: helix-turn-helix domain-containing protein [Gemmataceae bacterium]|nr:helix-turn-helix domain-containing protein [Gemmataceae bacterium]